MRDKIQIAIIGLGSRGRTAYGEELLTLQDRAEVTAVADPNEERLKLAGDAHGVPAERRFRSAEDLLAQPKLADAALVCGVGLMILRVFLTPGPKRGRTGEVTEVTE